jgi:predicted nucleic acid-binding protein
MIGADTTFLVQLELVELPAHQAAHELLETAILKPQIPLALAPQVLAEFIHVVTDPRRFQTPLTSEEALAKARFWWHAAEVRQVFQTTIPPCCSSTG